MELKEPPVALHFPQLSLPCLTPRDLFPFAFCVVLYSEWNPFCFPRRLPWPPFFPTLWQRGHWRAKGFFLYLLVMMMIIMMMIDAVVKFRSFMGTVSQAYATDSLLTLHICRNMCKYTVILSTMYVSNKTLTYLIVPCRNVFVTFTLYAICWAGFVCFE